MVFLILYGPAAFGAVDTTGTALWLNMAHLTASAIVPALGRAIDYAR